MALKHQIEIQAGDFGTATEKAIRQAALAVLAHQAVDAVCAVVIVIADDAMLRDLNLRFRGENQPTDVLSFANEARGPFAGGDRGARYLGDIIISHERATAQAAAVGGTVTQEMQLLTVHGVLHLLGYDHADAATKALMWEAQRTVLQHLGITIPLPE